MIKAHAVRATVRERGGMGKRDPRGVSMPKPMGSGAMTLLRKKSGRGWESWGHWEGARNPARAEYMSWVGQGRLTC